MNPLIEPVYFTRCSQCGGKIDVYQAPKYYDHLDRPIHYECLTQPRRS